MATIYKTSVVLLLLLIPMSGLYSQAAGGNWSPGKTVKWKGLAGNNNEFLAYLPEGFLTVSDGNFVTGSKKARVDKKITAARYINNVVLIVEFYEGDARGIKESLVKEEKSAPEKSDTINGFEFTQFLVPMRNFSSKKQFFQIKDRLYVVTAIAKSPENAIVKDFFNSITINNENKVVFPNAGNDVKSVSLKDVSETSPALTDDSSPFESKDTDRGPIILYHPRPKFPPSERGSAGYAIKVKSVFSASGLVTKVEILGNSSRAFEEAATEAAKRTKFIPAEKDGKLVSVYQIMEYSFSSF